MFRPCAAGVTVLNLLLAFAAAPHVHVHQRAEALVDDHARQTQTFRHAHVSAHRHDGEATDSEHRDDGAERTSWRLDTLLFQQTASIPTPPPALVAAGLTDSPVTVSWRVSALLHPDAHGPPTAFTRSLRAPPSFPPLS